MLLTAANMRVAVVTEHVPVKDIATYITKEVILSKLYILNNSLKRDFGIEKPRIAVLGLNPHAGDEGLVGDEEQKIKKDAWLLALTVPMHFLQEASTTSLMLCLQCIMTRD